MQKKSIAWLVLILSGLLIILVACGSTTPTSQTTPTSSHPTGPALTVPASESLYVLDGYPPAGKSATNSQQIIGFHSANPFMQLNLPVGLTSLDHQRLYAATTQMGQTTISVINTRTGTTLYSFVIPGAYTMNGQDFANSVGSADGHWLALRSSDSNASQTTIALVDTQARKLVKTIHLNGSFSLDAISPHGGIIYLLQYLNDGSNHYYVKAYDTRANRLLPTIIADKSELWDPRMVGTPLVRVMPEDGSFAYTLYIDPRTNYAFVHLLPLADKPEAGNSSELPVPQFARCIELPVGKSADALRYYTMALSRDGSSLYVANGATGLIVEIGLTHDIYNIFSDNITNQANFNPGTINMSSSDRTRMLYNAAALSPDGSTLYFAGVHGVWSVDTATFRPKTHYLDQQTFTGLAFSGGGKILYAVDPTHGITLLDAATGRAQLLASCPAQTPWGIAWIVS